MAAAAQDLCAGRPKCVLSTVHELGLREKRRNGGLRYIITGTARPRRYQHILPAAHPSIHLSLLACRTLSLLSPTVSTRAIQHASGIQ